MAKLRLIKKGGDTEDQAPYLQQLFQERGNRMFERLWMICLAFYVGNQYVDFNRITNTLMEMPRLRKHQVRLIVNKIQPAVQMAVGKMMKTMPKAEVIPPDGDEKKVNIAKVASHLLEYNDRKYDAEAKLQQMVLWATITGTAFLKHTWNPDLGDAMRDPETGDDFYEGDEDTTVCSPFEVAVDPLALEIEDARWAMHFRLYSKEYVKNMWGVDIEEEESVANGLLGMYDMRFASSVFSGGMYMAPKGVLVKEYWERPSDEYPDGRLIIVAGNKTVVNTKNYLGTLPFVSFRWFRVPNSLWGMGIVEGMLPLQKNYNRRRSQIAENANLLANPAWLAATGTFLRGKEPTNAPAQIVEYDPTAGAEPKPIGMPPLPSQVYQDMQQSDQEMSEVSGMRQIGPGMLPPGVRAAAALALINEMDQTQLTPVSRHLESVLRKSSMLRLALIRMFYTTPREIHIAGPNRSFAVEQFQGADLEGYYDIAIQSVSGLPQDKTARSELLMQYLQAGLIDQFKFLQMMELSDVDELFEDLQADINVAQWENDQMSHGKEMPVMAFDNHPTHIYEHHKYMRTLAFRKMSQEKQQLYILHVQGHENMQSQANGGQPQPPPTSQPQGGDQAQQMQQQAQQGPPGVLPNAQQMFQGTQFQGLPHGYNPASALKGGIHNVGDTLRVMQG